MRPRGCAGGERRRRCRDHCPLRQVDMKLLRESPLSCCESAWLLQVFILSCCEFLDELVEDDVELPLPLVDLRHSDMKLLRASPVRLCELAWLLQDFIFSCCDCCCALAIGSVATRAAVRVRANSVRMISPSLGITD